MSKVNKELFFTRLLFLRVSGLLVLRQQAGFGLTGLLLFLGGLFVVLFFLLFGIWGVTVPPDAIGVRQNKFTLGILKQGYDNYGLEPGRHWTMPLVSEVVLLPKDFQMVNFNAGSFDRVGGGVADALPNQMLQTAVQKGIRKVYQAGTSLGMLNLPALVVPSSSGSKISTDLTMIVRLFPNPGVKTSSAPKDAPDSVSIGDQGESVPVPKKEELRHGGPRDLIDRFKIDQKVILELFAKTAEESLIKALSSLSTTDFYNPKLRENAARSANQQINLAVNPHGVEVWATLIRRYTYADRSIDDQIFAKNLQEATESLNSAATVLAEARALTEKTRANWDAQIRNLQVDGKAKVDVMRSEGELYENQKVAEGDLLVTRAQAKVEKNKAEVLQSPTNAQVFLAREFAPLLESLKGGVVSGIDPYDIDAWLEKFSGKHGK